MNEELELQAYVDGELSGWSASRVRRRIANDPEAQRLVAELTTTRGFLKANEPERPLTEDRDFYWSRIREGILRSEQAEETAVPAGMVSWRRVLAPLAGVAMAVILAVMGFNWTPSIVEEPIRHVAEVENLSADTDSLSFRSASENMFVVWVHDKTGTTASDAEVIDDEDFSF
jgi:hypothetical protein